jgi:hypothetical protein
MVGRAQKRKRAAEHFKNFSQLLRLLINVNRNTALQRKGMEIATFLPILLGNSPSTPTGWLQVFGHFPAAFLYPLGISQRLPNSL